MSNWTPSVQLQELTKDQRERWHRGDKRLVEQYFDGHEELRSDQKLLLDFVCSEFTLRQEHGETPTLAEYTVGDQQFTLKCYRDSAGAHCVGIEHDGRMSVVQDVPVDEERLVNQGSSLISRGGPGVIYGRAHDSVTALYSLSTDGQRTDWPIYDDPQTGERYFAVVANTATLADIVAEAPTASRSLKVFFDMWFNPPSRSQSP